MKSKDCQEIVLMLRQLSVLIKTGIPVGEAVNMLLKKYGNPKSSVDKALEIVYTRLVGGASLSSAMQAANGIFPGALIAAVKAGEAGGILDSVLETQGLAMSKEYKDRETLKTIMIYPMFLLISLTVMVIFMLLMVIPIFSGLFDSMCGHLPWPTRLLINMGIFIQSWGVHLAFLFVALFEILRRWSKKNENKIKLHKFILNVPGIGLYWRQHALASWLCSLSRLLEAGVIVDMAVDYAAQGLDNYFLAKKLSMLRSHIAKGEGLANICKHIDIFDNFIIELMKAGEASGEMSIMLAEAGSMCQLEAENLQARLQAMIEPGIIMLAGIVTGFVILCIIWPILDMMSFYTGT